ncbi:MAG: hypothetical protein CFE28_06180 [Alphaproteobacteria bacterium PA2]|nr:MAG: hypothetical protein CFE28_06180 [Alphaproteobacteria bacterium PA2]
MEKQRKREITEAYKERKTRPGIFRVDCAASGACWVGISRNLDSAQNSVFFQLRIGGHRNKAMQADWATHGEAGFACSELEVLEVKDVSPYILDRLLKERLAHWRGVLGAGSVIG